MPYFVLATTTVLLYRNLADVTGIASSCCRSRKIATLLRSPTGLHIHPHLPLCPLACSFAGLFACSPACLLVCSSPRLLVCSFALLCAGATARPLAPSCAPRFSFRKCPCLLIATTPLRPQIYKVSAAGCRSPLFAIFFLAQFHTCADTK